MIIIQHYFMKVIYCFLNKKRKVSREKIYDIVHGYHLYTITYDIK